MRSRADELAGYDVDVAKAVAEKLGVDVEFVETPWDAMFAALEADRFDIVANEVTISDERKQKYDLSEPYSISQGVIVTRKDDDSIKSLADLKGKRTAQNPTSNWAEIARNAGSEVESVDGFSQAITVLNDGPRGRRRQRQHLGARLSGRDTPTPRSRSPSSSRNAATRRSRRARTAGCCRS